MQLFTEHPTEVGESYLQHLRYAISVGVRMIVSGMACTIHGFLPFLFKSNGSNAIAHLHNLMMEKRSSVYAEKIPRDKSSVQASISDDAERKDLAVKLNKAA